MSTSTTVIKNTGYLYVKMAITMLMSLYTTRLIFNGLGEKGFGIFNIIAGAIIMLSFLNGPMAQTTQRFLNYYGGSGQLNLQKKVFSTSFLLHATIGVFVCILLEIGFFFLFDLVLNIPKENIYAAKWVYQFTVISTFFSILSVPYEASLNAHENMFYFSFVGIFESLLKLLTALYIVQTGFDKLIVYGLFMAIISIIKVLLMRVYCLKKYEECKLSYGKGFDFSLVKEMTSFASWSFVGSIAGMASSQGSALVINNYFGVVINAAQGIANQLSGQLMNFSSNMIKALNPVIVKKEGANDRIKMLEASLTGSKISFIIMAFFAIPFIIEMPFILKLWLKNPPEYAIVFCRLLLIKSLFNQLGVTFGTAIGAVGNIKGMTIVYTLFTFSVLPFSYIAFKFGYDATYFYYIYMIIDIILLFISVGFMKKNCGMSIKFYFTDIFIKCISFAIFVAVVGYIFANLINNETTELLSVVAISCTLFTVGAYYLLLNKTERKILIILKEKLLKLLNRK
jgi:O-antigen/teichoic acid export membrane protein